MAEENQISELQERDTNRLETFSDGVFAIAITLLILNIHLPDASAKVPLATALEDQWPSYLAYLLSFLTVLNIWVNHHNTFAYITRTDHWFLFLNGLLLMGVCVFPFPTALLAQYFTTSNQFVATLVYAGVFTYNGLSYFLLWAYASAGMRLLDGRLDPIKIRKLRQRHLTKLPVYAAALILVFFYPPGALVIYFLLMLFYLLPGISVPGPEKLYRVSEAEKKQPEVKEAS
jgi:uncharacterized membrane protein